MSRLRERADAFAERYNATMDAYEAEHGTPKTFLKVLVQALTVAAVLFVLFVGVSTVLTALLGATVVKAIGISLAVAGGARLVWWAWRGR
jgi:hypothetical protein